jgi:hypothetical protein
MKELLILVAIGIPVFAFVKVIILKEPLFPWKDKSEVRFNSVPKKKKKKTSKHSVELDQEPELFQELFKDIQEIEHSMIRFKDNQFTMIAEVEPVNYFLKSQDEQEAIDITFETWLAQINYNVIFYLQNRYIDLTEPIETMKKNMREADDLNEDALSYGQSMIEDLLKWQTYSPRYETKRFLIMTHTINPNDITAENKEELEQKIVDKAYAELMRRFNTAKNQLRKAGITIKVLNKEGIIDLLYHTFNRKKAVKNRFKDFASQEMTALYVTADTTAEQIEAVKELLKHETSFEEQEKAG